MAERIFKSAIKPSDSFYYKTYYPGSISPEQSKLTGLKALRAKLDATQEIVDGPRTSLFYFLNFRFVYEFEGKIKYEYINIPNKIIRSFSWEFPSPMGRMELVDASGYFSSNLLFRFLSPSYFSLKAEFNIAVGKPKLGDNNYAYEDWISIKFANPPEVTYDGAGRLQFGMNFFLDLPSSDLSKQRPPLDSKLNLTTGKSIQRQERLSKIKEDINQNGLPSLSEAVNTPTSDFFSIKQILDYLLLYSIELSFQPPQDADPKGKESSFKMLPAFQIIKDISNIPLLPEITSKKVKQLNTKEAEKEIIIKNSPIRTYYYGNVPQKNLISLNIDDSFSQAFTMFTTLSTDGTEVYDGGMTKKEGASQNIKITKSSNIQTNYLQLKEFLLSTTKSNEYADDSQILIDDTFGSDFHLADKVASKNTLDLFYDERIIKVTCDVGSKKEAIDFLILKYFSPFSALKYGDDEDQEEANEKDKDVNNLESNISSYDAFKFLAGRDLYATDPNKIKISRQKNYVGMRDDKVFPIFHTKPLVYPLEDEADGKALWTGDKAVFKENTESLSYTDLRNFLFIISNPKVEIIENTDDPHVREKFIRGLVGEDTPFKRILEARGVFETEILPIFSNFQYKNLIEKIDELYGGELFSYANTFIREFFSDNFTGRNGIKKTDLLDKDFVLEGKPFVDFRTTFKDSRKDKNKDATKEAEEAKKYKEDLEKYDIFFFKTILDEVKRIKLKPKADPETQKILVVNGLNVILKNYLKGEDKTVEKTEGLMLIRYIDENIERFADLYIEDQGKGAIIEQMIQRQMSLFNEWLVVRRFFTLFTKYALFCQSSPPPMEDILGKEDPKFELRKYKTKKEQENKPLMLRDVVTIADGTAIPTPEEQKKKGKENFVDIKLNFPDAEYLFFNTYVDVELAVSPGKMDFNPNKGEWETVSVRKLKVTLKSTLQSKSTPPDIDITNIFFKTSNIKKLNSTKKTKGALAFDTLIRNTLYQLSQNLPMTMTATVLGDPIYHQFTGAGSATKDGFEFFKSVVDMKIFEIEKLTDSFFSTANSRDVAVKASQKIENAKGSAETKDKINIPYGLDRRHMNQVLSTMFSDKYVVMGAKHTIENHKWKTELSLQRLFGDVPIKPPKADQTNSESTDTTRQPNTYLDKYAWVYNLKSGKLVTSAEDLPYHVIKNGTASDVIASLLVEDADKKAVIKDKENHAVIVWDELLLYLLQKYDKKNKSQFTKTSSVYPPMTTIVGQDSKEITSETSLKNLTKKDYTDLMEKGSLDKLYNIFTSLSIILTYYQYEISKKVNDVLPIFYRLHNTLIMLNASKEEEVTNKDYLLLLPVFITMKAIEKKIEKKPELKYIKEIWDKLADQKINSLSSDKARSVINTVMETEIRDIATKAKLQPSQYDTGRKTTSKPPKDIMKNFKIEEEAIIGFMKNLFNLSEVLQHSTEAYAIYNCALSATNFSSNYLALINEQRTAIPKFSSKNYNDDQFNSLSLIEKMTYIMQTIFNHNFTNAKAKNKNAVTPLWVVTSRKIITGKPRYEKQTVVEDGTSVDYLVLKNNPTSALFYFIEINPLYLNSTLQTLK